MDGRKSFDIEDENRDEVTLEEQDAEYARRVLRDVQYMESPREQETPNNEDEKYESEAGGRGFKIPKPLWLFLSGNLLLQRGFTKYYGHLVIIAAVLLLSIIVMFWSLHLDMSYNTLVRDVQLLRERSIRLQEVRFSRCSHSSIVDELERRGIELVDPTTPATVIEKGKLR